MVFDVIIILSPCYDHVFMLEEFYWFHMSGKAYVDRAQKFRIAFEARRNGSSVDEACKKAGISRSSYFRWQNMLKEYCQDVGGEESLNWAFDNLHMALSPRSKRPKNLARKIDQDKRDKILEVAKSGNHSSGLSVANALKEEGMAISVKKVISVLREEGIYSDLKKGMLIYQRYGVPGV